MPEPLSSTVTELSEWIVTSMVVGASSHRFIDRVVHDLPDQVVKPALHHVADVHVRPLANSLEALEHLDVFGPVLHGTVAVGRGEVRLDGLQGRPRVSSDFVGA